MVNQLKIWEDIGYFATAEPHSHWCDFVIHVLLWIDDGNPIANKKDATSSPDPAASIEDSQIFLHGSIKWDGCSNWQFDEQERVMLHFCGRKNATNLGILMDRLYDWASEVIPHWDAKCAE
jgi:hypothetical protein